MIKAGEKVGVSHAVLLQKLKINPFRYGAVIDVVYDNGVVYGAKALEMTDAEVLKKFQEGIQAVTAVSLEANIPTEAACPHIMMNALQAILGFAKESNVMFPLAEKIFSNMAAAPVAVAAAEAPKEEEKKEEEPAEEEEEEDYGGLMDLF